MQTKFSYQSEDLALVSNFTAMFWHAKAMQVKIAFSRTSSRTDSIVFVVISWSQHNINPRLAPRTATNDKKCSFLEKLHCQRQHNHNSTSPVTEYRLRFVAGTAPAKTSLHKSSEMTPSERLSSDFIARVDSKGGSVFFLSAEKFVWRRQLNRFCAFDTRVVVAQSLLCGNVIRS